MKNNYLILLLVLGCLSNLSAQIGGRYAFEFVNLPTSARATALGGHIPFIHDGDLSAAYANPANLSAKTANQLILSHDFYLADITRGYLAYGWNAKKWNMNMHAGLQYINYGDLIRTNEFGQVIGDFNASEIAFIIGSSKQLHDNISLGVNLRFMSSSLADFNSLGLSSDIGMTYHKEDKRSTIALVFRNMGAQLTQFNNESENLPFDIQLAFSKRLEHLPFRYSIVANHLNRWDIAYDNPEDDEIPVFGANSNDQSGTFIDNLFRHLTFSGELSFGKEEVVRLRLAYSYLRSQELQLDNFRNLAGFSFGFGLKLKKFNLDYGIGKYNVQANAHHLTLSTNLSNFKKESLIN